MKVLCAVLTAITMACLSPGQAFAKSGSLVIVGGGLKSDTEDVWKAFISSARDTGSLVIVPSASGEPMRSARSVEKTLRSYGVSADRIEIAPLALFDDPSTADVDEADWRLNADDPVTAALVSKAAAIWFTGGDQKRTTDLLLKNGRDTLVMKAIRTAKETGAAIGGTSAGAAIMSEQMILRGDSLGALISPDSGEPLQMGQGLSFLKTGLVDQHFGERARLGRLSKALFHLDSEDRIGFGIDENTALIIDADGSATVAGSGYVTVIDGRNAAQLDEIEGRSRLTGLTLHMASAGDEVDILSGEVKAAPWKKTTIEQEYRTVPLSSGGGIILPGVRLETLIGEGLVDNSASQLLERPGFDQLGRGVMYRFTQTSASMGYWGRDETEHAGYTISGIEFDIRPVSVTIQELSHDE